MKEVYRISAKVMQIGAGNHMIFLEGANELLPEELNETIKNEISNMMLAAVTVATAPSDLVEGLKDALRRGVK